MENSVVEWAWGTRSSASLIVHTNARHLPSLRKTNRQPSGANWRPISLYTWAAWSNGLDVRRGGGETYAELAARIERAILRIASSAGRDPILVVSHGGSIKSYVSKVLGVSPEGLRALAGVGNCGLTIVELDSRNRVRLHAWNDTAHLEGLLASEKTD